MRNLLYTVFCLVLVMGVGCALTDYETITDNGQFAEICFTGDDDDDDFLGYVVDTLGKAHVIPTGQVATLWPDGTDNLLWFIDQAANGDREIYTYNMYWAGYYVDCPEFIDDLYCAPDWAGCAVWVAEDDGDACDPALGGCFANYQFDGVADKECLGIRSLSTLLATTRYFGECGNGQEGGPDGDVFSRPGLADMISLVNMAEVGSYLGMDGLWMNYDHNSLTLMVNGVALPVADGKVFYSIQRKNTAVFLQNPMNSVTLRAMGDVWAKGTVANVEVCQYGICFGRSAKAVKDFHQSAQDHF